MWKIPFHGLKKKKAKLSLVLVSVSLLPDSDAI